MIRYPIAFMLCLGLGGAAQAASLEPLTEKELSGVTGREGILVSLEYYYNIERTNDPGTTGQALIGGTHGCSMPDGGASLGNVNCRLALQLENRETEWLVFKNGYASLVINRLSLDAAFLGDASSAANTGFYNNAKFVDENGSCLLGPGNCTASYIAEMPAVRAHYPQTDGSYDHVMFSSTGYSDARFGMYFEGLAVEPGEMGWQSNANGSFMGAKIADNNGPQAGIAFGGDFYMYGF